MRKTWLDISDYAVEIRNAVLNKNSTDDKKALEGILQTFTGSEETRKSITQVLNISKKLSSDRPSLLENYLSILQHNAFNDTVFLDFVQEIEARVNTYSQQTTQKPLAPTKRTFQKSLTTLLSYAHREDEKLIDVRRGNAFSEVLTKDSAYEMLLYARALNTTVIIPTWDKRFVNEKKARKIVEKTYHELHEELEGKKLYKAIGQAFQEKKQFTLSEQEILDFIPKTMMKVEEEQEKELKLNQRNDSQHYA